MRYTLLGRTGLRVSQLGLGTMTFGEEWGWGMPKARCARVLDLFAEHGGTLLDTANFYTGGTAERLLGELLEGRRDQFVLASKYSLETPPAGTNDTGNHRKNLVRSLEGSLRRLRTDYIDVYWVHVRDMLTPVEEVMRALDDQVRAGKVLYVGVSDWPAWEVAHANTLADLRGWTPFAGLQLQYSLLERTPERELLPMARAFDIGVVVWGALAGGLLTGKYEQDASPDGVRGRLEGPCGWDNHLGESAHVRAKRVLPELAAIAEAGGWTAAQVALAWLAARPAVSVRVLGVTSEAQLRENLAAHDIRLEDEHLRRLDEASRIELGFPHDFLRGDDIKLITYGEAGPRVDDRRTRSQRAVTDALW